MKVKIDLFVNIDGSCEPVNPGGNLGWGFIIKKAGETIASYFDFREASPENSNNVAEYMALNDALLWLIKEKLNDQIILILSDSMLVVSQMNGWWRIKSGLYKEYALTCQGLIKNYFKNIRFQWIPREQNEEADKLSKLRQTDLTEWS